MTEITVNGTPRHPESERDTSLLCYLRDELGSTETRFGCGAGFCGCCTVQTSRNKDAAFVRSNFDGMQVSISDTPRANEVIVAVVVAAAHWRASAALCLPRKV